MKTRNHILGIFLAFFICTVFSAQQGMAQEIVGFEICGNVEDLEPVDPKTDFAQGEKAYCWLKVKGATVGSKIVMKWFHGEEEKYSKELEMKFSTMRTYAYKTLYQAGTWRVDIYGEGDNLLQSAELQAVAN